MAIPPTQPLSVRSTSHSSVPPEQKSNDSDKTSKVSIASLMDPQNPKTQLDSSSPSFSPSFSPCPSTSLSSFHLLSPSESSHLTTQKVTEKSAYVRFWDIFRSAAAKFKKE